MHLPILGLNAWNSYFCLAVGLFLNSLLFFVAKKYSSSNLSEYRNSTFIYCAFNCILLFVQAILQPIFLIGSDKRGYIFSAGPIAVLDFWGSFSPKFCFIFYAFLLNLSIFGLALQFMNRYLIICRNYFCRRLTLGAFVFVSAFLTIFCPLIGYLNVQIDDQNVVADIYENGIETAKLIGKYNSESTVTRILFLFNGADFSLQYFLIIFCFLRIRTFLKENLIENVAGINRKTLKQILKSMLIQALVPFYALNMISVVFFWFAIGNYSSEIVEQIFLLAFVPLDWLPVLNPLVTLLTIEDYRMGAFRLLKKCRVGQQATITPVKFITEQIARNT